MSSGTTTASSPKTTAATCRHVVPVILCGGVGTRLWPLSRTRTPKQLLALGGTSSLVQDTARRVTPSAMFAAPIVVCGEDLRFQVAREFEAAGVVPALMIVEPARRGTAAALAAAALVADPQDVLLALPADAGIGDVAALHDAIRQGLGAAGRGRLVVFGVAPTRPETGYGYIRASPRDADGEPPSVESFHEKPDAETAAAYLAEGTYLWNAGMFMLGAGDCLASLQQHAPEVLDAVRLAVSHGRRDATTISLDPAGFLAAPSTSFDHAVMENTDRATVVTLDAGWTDLGSWQELWRSGTRDSNDNVAVGDVMSLDTRGSYVHAEGRLVATIGLRDHLVVATADAVVVAPLGRSQDVGLVVDLLERTGRHEHRDHPRVRRPWGYYETIDQGTGYQVKRIVVDPGGRLSLQRHAHRSEHWTVVGGTARITVDNHVDDVAANGSAYIPVGAIHRLENLTEEPVVLIEVQCGGYLGEDDIERLEDIYDRAAPLATQAAE